MDRDVYQRLERIEDTHWWFKARRLILRSVISRFSPRSDLRVLEAGCGTGGNLAMLAQFGRVEAFELDESARLIACAKSNLDIRSGALPDTIPFTSEEFDVIAAFDVIEHVERDVESLASLANRLAPGGRLYVTVPALPWLWSRHDEAHHHHRRYTRRTLLNRLQRAGLKPLKVTYFNTLLFPLIAIMRFLRKLANNRTAVDERIPPAPLNRLLEWIFASEAFLIGRIRLPIGVSLLAIAERQ